MVKAIQFAPRLIELLDIGIVETRSAPASSPEWLDELDYITASYRFPLVRDRVDYSPQEYKGLTPEKTFQHDWVGNAVDSDE